MRDPYPRIVERLLDRELLPAFPALLLVGPRGTGKSTSAARFASTIIDLSVPGPRISARQDPDGLLASASGTVVIDEWQEAPEILGAVKRRVDAEPSDTVNRIILTGSVRAAHQTTTWPGTGRLIRVRMWGLTQGEIEHDHTYNPIEQLFAPPQLFSQSHLSSASVPPLGGPCNLTRSDYIQRIVAGRFPYIQEMSDRNRSRWFASYVEQLAEFDAPQVAVGTPRPTKLRSVLTSCAARTGQVLNQAATARDAGVTSITAEAHLRLLEDLSIVVRLPAWHSKRLYRLTRSPKVHIADPGLAAHLMNTNETHLAQDATLVGQLFETFVLSELLPHLEAVSTTTEMFHFRDHAGREVDFIVERGGQIVGLEVKSSTKVGRQDAKSLLWLRDQLGDRFHLGVVLYAGQFPFRISDRIWALPLGALWRPV
ncbi:MAG: DUF4143 domain-containing protein [bacterium]|nr:DUF4143 domain-containing protein [bacterium]